MLINNSVVDNQIGDETVLLDLNTGQYFVLNDVASMAWNGFKNNKDISVICEEISTQFDEDKATIEKHVQELTEEFLKKKILVTT